MSGGGAGSLVIDTVAGNAPLHVLLQTRYGWVVSVAWCGDHIVSGHSNGEVNIWSATERTLLSSFHAHLSCTAVDVSPVEPHRIISGGSDGLIKLWTLAGERVWTPHVSVGLSAGTLRDDFSVSICEDIRVPCAS